jgi:hypothetical protein
MIAMLRIAEGWLAPLIGKLLKAVDGTGPAGASRDGVLNQYQESLTLRRSPAAGGG